MIKNFVINNSMNLVNTNNQYNKEQLEEIKYGLESIYLLITKFVVIFTISLILGLLKESMLFFLFFNILRSTAFGIHASKSIYCWISSTICFIILPYISKIIIIPNIFFIIATIICNILFILYAPADTVKRPLINEKKRKRFKFITIISSIILTTIIFTISNNTIKNLIMFAMALQIILILPITYKIFKLPYNNYKNYK